MTRADYLTLLMRAADANVTGCAIIRPGMTLQPHWHFVERPEGVLRIDTESGERPNNEAVTVALTADLSEAAITAYADSLSPDKTALRTTAANMVAEIDAYLAIADTATQSQVRAAVKTLAIDMRRLIKYLATTI